MKVTVRSPEGVRYCEGCKSEHLGLRCPSGTKYIDRLRTTRLDGSVTSSQTKQNYYSDEGLKAHFGLDRKERKEQMMDDTKGLGYYDKNRPLSDSEAKVFFGD